VNAVDYVILLGALIGIASYGIWRTRGKRDFNTYMKGSRETGWLTIGLSVMATQASAVTFLSTPGQGYESGLGFVQNYFGAPLALIVIAAVFLPIYRRLKVYTAYEYLGHRFDSKTRLLGAGIFLLQRGIGAGITIYAPAIVLSTVMGWPLGATIHRPRRVRGRESDPEIPDRHHLLRDGRGVLRPPLEAAGRAHVLGHAHAGGRLP
jgi:Na+/proline symporter